MTDWDHQKLYDLKGQIVASGVKAVTGMDMPVFEKRRFQHGAASPKAFASHFPEGEKPYRKEFLSKYE
jgi:asparagine synthase (glutamine-hydrolysing)